jgi:hypothetical protein
MWVQVLQTDGSMHGRGNCHVQAAAEQVWREFVLVVGGFSMMRCTDLILTLGRGFPVV